MAILPRSYLYVPGNKPELFVKACNSGADAIILDLEDAVPAAEKLRARETAMRIVAEPRPVGAPVVVIRINAGAAGIEEARSLPVAGLHALSVPKAEDPSQIAELAEVLAQSERRAGMAEASVALIPLIESVKGLYGLEGLVRASTRVHRASFGAGDFVSDLGGRWTAGRLETLQARSMLVAHSVWLGLKPPIAHAFAPIADQAGLARACEEDRDLGFGARSCIHPRQVERVNAAFGVSPQERARAENIIAVFEAAAARGSGAIVLADGTFIDEALVRWARDICSRGDTP